jgi:anti-anti-sigma factor
LTTTVDPFVKTQWFAAQFERRDQTFVVSMSGNADMEIHEQLKKFLSELHMLARAARATEVVFQFHQLYFMNSSCMSLLLRFINEIADSRVQDQYKVRLRSNPDQRWQRKSFDAMRAYSPDLVTVE